MTFEKVPKEIEQFLIEERKFTSKGTRYLRLGQNEFTESRFKHGRYALLSQQMDPSYRLDLLISSKRIAIFKLVENYAVAVAKNDLLSVSLWGRSLIERLAYFAYFIRQIKNHPLPDKIDLATGLPSSIANDLMQKINRGLFQTSIDLFGGEQITLKKKKLNRFDPSKVVYREILGVKEEVEGADLTPLNILTPIDQIEKTVPGIKNSYFFLSEFVHPNFGDVFSATQMSEVKRNEFGDPVFVRLMTSNQSNESGHLEYVFSEIKEILFKAVNNYAATIATTENYQKKLKNLCRAIVQAVIREKGLKKIGLRKGTLCPCLSGLKIKDCLSKKN